MKLTTLLASNAHLARFTCSCMYVNKQWSCWYRTTEEPTYNAGVFNTGRAQSHFHELHSFEAPFTMFRILCHICDLARCCKGDSCSVVFVNDSFQHLLSTGLAASLGCVRMKVAVSRNDFRNDRHKGTDKALSSEAIHSDCPYPACH